jgi:glycosyltransferase involved in cell wall biosynthesis
VHIGEMINAMKTISVSAIVPFYNEEQRIFYVLDVLGSIKNIDEIICVNDGSTDHAPEKIKEKYENIILMQNPYNQGKSAAVAKGIRKAQGEYIFLIDADISNLKKNELETAITRAKQSDMHMVILRRVHDHLGAKITRGDILVSGERILKKSDLLGALETNPRKYQLETAINLYMMKNHKNVSWLPYSGKNIPKIKKRGLICGIIEEIEMNYSIYAFAGIGQYFKLMNRFCKHRM